MNKKNDEVAKLRPIFIVTQGRSGSTWLQKIINVQPDIFIWGEHSGFLNDWAKSFFKIEDRSHIRKTDKENVKKEFLLDNIYRDDFNPVWTVPFSKESFLIDYRDFILKIFANDISENKRWGFKEIRYCNFETLSFLYKLFPHAQFIFLKRDIVNVCRSQVKLFYNDVWDDFSYDEKEKFILQNIINIKMGRKDVDDFKNNLSDYYFIDVSYENLLEKFDDEVKRIFDFLQIDGIGKLEDILGKVKKGKIHPTEKDDSIEDLIREVLSSKKVEIDNKISGSDIEVSHDEIRMEKQRELIRLMKKEKQESDQVIRNIKKIIKKQEKDLDVLSNSKYFAFKKLIHRSCKNPYKWITFPYNFINIIFKKSKIL